MFEFFSYMYVVYPSQFFLKKNKLCRAHDMIFREHDIISCTRHIISWADIIFFFNFFFAWLKYATAFLAFGFFFIIFSCCSVNILILLFWWVVFPWFLSLLILSDILNIYMPCYSACSLLLIKVSYSTLQPTMRSLLVLAVFIMAIATSYADEDEEGCKIIFGPNIGDTLPNGEKVFIDPCVFCECPQDALPGTHASCDRLRCPPLPRNCTNPVTPEGECCVTCEWLANEISWRCWIA